MTFAVFGQTLHHKFVDLDDGPYVFNNPVVARGLTPGGFAWAFSSHAANWHPLTWLSHELDCQLYGLRPGGHHLTSVLLHAATVIALFLVLRRMTGALWRSAFVAAVFAIHPLRVESVAWVAERKDVLSGLFFVLTLGAYARYARRPGSPGLYGLVALLFALGLMCKPMLVTLPLVLLLLDYWPLQRLQTQKLSGLVMEKLPLLALSAGCSIATLLAQAETEQLTSVFPMPLRLANAVVSCRIYLDQMIWPAGLIVVYPYPHGGLPAREVVMAALILTAVSALAWNQRRKGPWLLMGWLWYLVMLLPVLGIIQVGLQAHADRYTYLPQIGLYVALTWWAAEWRLSRAVLGGLMAAVLAVLMVCAWQQSSYWKNDETLWTHLLSSTPNSPMGNYLLGNALSRAGRVEEAKAHYEKALRLKPDMTDAWNNLGNLLMQEGKVDEAASLFQKALQIKPDNIEALVNLGAAREQQGRLNEAISLLQKAVQLRPDSAQACNNLGGALLQAGKVAEAIPQIQQAMLLRPADPMIRNNLAWVLAAGPQASLRDGKKALDLARQANALTGGEDPVVLHTLAAALAETGRFGEAVETARHALRLAEAQTNSKLAGELRTEMPLYQAGRPFHRP
jgi:Flp pilus assembly protein TadD